MLRSSGLDEERKRHDKAVEQLQAAQAEWSKQRTERLDWINEELRRQGHAVQTFHDVDMAIREYARVTGHNLDNTFGVMGSEPQITDFYTPSGDQKNREIAFVVVGLAATGLAAFKLAKWSELTVPDCIGSSSPYGRYDISSEADNFPPDFLRHRYNDTTCQDGIAGRAILCYARGRPLRQPPQDSWSSGHTMIDIARKSLELWRRDERAAMRFATMVLAGPTNLRETTGQLSEPVALACWRLIRLLEYLASLDDGREEAANQASDG